MRLGRGTACVGALLATWFAPTMVDADEAMAVMANGIGTNPAVRLTTCYALGTSDRMESIREAASALSERLGTDDEQTLATSIMAVGGHVSVAETVIAGCRSWLEPWEIKIYSPAIYGRLSEIMETRFLLTMAAEDKALSAFCDPGSLSDMDTDFAEAACAVLSRNVERVSASGGTEQ